MKISPEEILKILEENGIKFATRVNVECPNGHRYAIKINDLDGVCPECVKYTKEYIEDMIEKRRAKSLRIKDDENEKFTPAGIYIVKLTRDDESFFKIGISTKSAHERLKDIPYSVEIINVIFTNSCGANFIERALHKVHDDAGLSYVPKIGFTGCSECFSEILNDEIQSFIDNQEESTQKTALTWLKSI